METVSGVCPSIWKVIIFLEVITIKHLADKLPQALHHQDALDADTQYALEKWQQMVGSLPWQRSITLL